VADSSHDNPLEAFGDNEWLVDEMHEQYKKDPSSVDEAWGKFFASQSSSGNGRSAEPKADAPKADAAKPALLAAMKDANEADKPQIVWALVTLKEPAAFKDAMEQYRAGHLSKVERLGGGSAFDPEMLAGLVSLDELAKLTEAEKRILTLVGEGLTNRQIAERLGLAEKTVKNHVSRLLGKLGLERRTQAAVLVTKLRSHA